MGGQNKLLAELEGIPVVAWVVSAVLSSQAKPVIVLTGHEAEQIRRALASYDVEFVHNSRYAHGISTSLQRGLTTLPADIDGVLVCLGDMPGITVAHIDRIVSNFNPAKGCAICVPTCKGKRGNPVLWDKRFFAEMNELSGDVGARHLISKHAALVCEVEIGDEAILTDVDKSEDLISLRHAHK